jgi:hypothetical protein
MDINKLSVEGLSKRIDALAPEVGRVLRDERAETYGAAMIAACIREIVTGKLDDLEHGLDEMFTSPERSEFQELAAILERRSAAKKVSVVHEKVEAARQFGDENVFSGKRAFSKRKMAAMIEYLTAQGRDVYKTSLNKLLFYSDLTNFYLTGHGISGAVYYNRRFGPVADPAEPVLAELVAEDKVRIHPRVHTLATAADPDLDGLTAEEQKVLDWVVGSYGTMSAGEVSEYSHNEMAYKFTEPNEPIAYAYAQFLKKLPPKDLLGH